MEGNRGIWREIEGHRIRGRQREIEGDTGGIEAT